MVKTFLWEYNGYECYIFELHGDGFTLFEMDF